MSTIYIRALDDNTGANAKVNKTDDFQKDVLKLFKKIYKVKFGAIKWFAGVPGIDIAVVYQATPYKGSRQEYLHLSYSDLRTLCITPPFVCLS